MSVCVFERHSDYCSLRFTPEVSNVSRAHLQAVMDRAHQLLSQSRQQRAVMDLSRLTIVSDEFASVLEAELCPLPNTAETGFQFVIASPNDSVTGRLNQTRIPDIAAIVDSLEGAYALLGVTESSEPVVESISVQIPSEQPFEFVPHRRHVDVLLNPILNTMDWEEVTQATSDLLKKLDAAETPHVSVDLSRMEVVNSGLVASLVQIWKATKAAKGEFAVVSPNEFVTGVLKTAGLLRLWKVVETQSEAVYELGVSTAATLERRERRLLTYVCVGCAVLALLATLLMFTDRSTMWGVNSQLTALLLSSAAIATGLISLLKDSGFSRKLAMGSVVAGCLVLSTLWFKENPLSFRHQFPERRFGQDAGENQTQPVDTTADSEASAAADIQDDATEQTSDGSSEDAPSTGGRSLVTPSGEDKVMSAGQLLKDPESVQKLQQ